MGCFWIADQLAGSWAERLYGCWLGHQQRWHDEVELGERVADALLEEEAKQRHGATIPVLQVENLLS